MAMSGGWSRSLVVFGLAAALGCAEIGGASPSLVPAVGAERAAAVGPRGVTVAVDGNVPRVARLVAPGAPPLVPVRVTVANDSRRRIQIRHADFALADGAGHVARALSPSEVDAALPSPP